jgi:glycosyltransferase involved in cell wall biosynthesis
MPDLPERAPIAQAPLSAILLASAATTEVDEVVSAWDSYLSERGRPYEIVLVDDGCNDLIKQDLQKLAGQKPSLRFMTHDQHRGLGAALRTGLQNVRHPLVVTVPCDKQYQPADLYRPLDAIDQVDLVVGYRVGLPIPAWLRLARLGKSLLARVFLGAGLEPYECWPGATGWRRRWLARWVFGVRVQDPECPLRLYRREIFERLPIQCDSSAALIEILAKANHLECIMAEVPVSWVPPKSSAINPIDQRVRSELKRLFFEPQFTAPSNSLPDTPRQSRDSAP